MKALRKTANITVNKEAVAGPEMPEAPESEEG
jgi:hypothetical protein